jgi:integration host factor subunit beta
VTKKEIVRRISDRAELTQLKTKEIVQWTFDAIIDTLITDGRIELRNFGVFEVRRRKARRARNPRTNDRVDVPEKNVVTFQPGKEMEERVREDAKVYEPKRKKAKPSANSKTKPAPAPAATPAPAKAKSAPKAKAKPAAPEMDERPQPLPEADHVHHEPELVGAGAPADVPNHDAASAPV